MYCLVALHETRKSIDAVLARRESTDLLIAIISPYGCVCWYPYNWENFVVNSFEVKDRATNWTSKNRNRFFNFVRVCLPHDHTYTFNIRLQIYTVVHSIECLLLCECIQSEQYVYCEKKCAFQMVRRLIGGGTYTHTHTRYPYDRLWFLPSHTHTHSIDIHFTRTVNMIAFLILSSTRIAHTK